MSHATHDNPQGLATEWLVMLPLAALLVTYLVAAARQHRLHRAWSPWRTSACIVGIALLAVAVSPLMADRAHHDLRGHTIQHLLVGMFAPLALVFAAPVTLLLRTIPAHAGRRVAAVLGSRPMHLIGYPITALTLNIGGLYALYLTPLYAISRSSPVLHTAVTIHFLAAGYLFAWSIAGPDPAPRRPGMTTRVIVLASAIAAHAVLGKLMYAHLWPRGTSFAADQIRDAAELMYYGGDLAELLLAVALFGTWYSKRRRARRRVRSRAESQENGHPQAPVVSIS